MNVVWIVAKRLIEDFYGLNELEYEREDDENETERNNLIKSLKRKFHTVKLCGVVNIR